MMAHVRGTDSERHRPLSEASRTFRVVVHGFVTLTAIGYLFTALSFRGADYARFFGSPAVWVVLALMVVADLYPRVPWLRDVHGQVLIHWSAALALSLVLAFGPVSIVLFPLMGFIAVIGPGGAPHRVVVNVCIMVVEGIAAALVVESASASLVVGAHGTWFYVGIGVALALLWNLINIVVVTTFLELSGPETAWWRRFRSGVVTTRFWLGGLLLAPMLAQLAVSVPQMLLLLIVVIVAVHHNAAIVARSAIQARTDPLTGLANRRAVMEKLEQVSSPLYSGPAITVCLIDLDGFKAVNDTFGHDVGDRVLIGAARLLVAAVPPDLLVARLGGDEFVVVGGSPEDAAVREREIVQNVSTPLQIGEHTIAVGCTTGSATASRGREPFTVIRAADRLLYRAKAARDPETPGVPLPDARPIHD